MKNFVLMAALLAAAVGAQAQNAAAGSVSGSEAQAAAGAISGAGASANSEININLPAVQPLAEVTNRNIQSGTATIKAAPQVTVTGPASGPCTGKSGGVGASWLGGGIGGNFADVDVSCTLRENARVLAMLLPVLQGADKDKLHAMLMQTLERLMSESIPQPK